MTLGDSNFSESYPECRWYNSNKYRRTVGGSVQMYSTSDVDAIWGFFCPSAFVSAAADWEVLGVLRTKIRPGVGTFVGKFMSSGGHTYFWLLLACFSSVSLRCLILEGSSGSKASKVMLFSREYFFFSSSSTSGGDIPVFDVKMQLELEIACLHTEARRRLRARSHEDLGRGSTAR